MLQESGPDTTLDLDVPMTTIQHDHTRLDILFEDLRALTQQGLAGEIELLVDAREQWETLRQDIARHFVGEERSLLEPLARRFPAFRTQLEVLPGQHLTILSLLARMGPLFEDGSRPTSPSDSTLPGSTVSGPTHSGTEIEALWKSLDQLWQEHSALEWKIIQEIEVQIRREAMQKSVTDQG